MATGDGFTIIEANDHSTADALKFLRNFLRKNRGRYWDEVQVDNASGLTLTSFTYQIKLHFNTPRWGGDSPETRAAAKIMSLTHWGDESKLLRDLIERGGEGGVYWIQAP